MNLNGQHIKLVTNHSEAIMPTVIKIQRHVKKGWKFALHTKDQTALIVYDPKTLSAGYSTGEFINYTDKETFVNCIQLALYEYSEFVTLHEPKLDKPKNKIITNG